MAKGKKRKSMNNTAGENTADGGLVSPNDKGAGHGKQKPAQMKNKGSEKKVQKEGMVSKHKSSLDKLKDQDPEFYEFLKNEDQKLLKFDDSDSDVSEDDADADAEADAEAEADADSGEEDKQFENGNGSDEDSDSSDDDQPGGYVHRLPDKLEVQSGSEDEDDSEEEKETKKKKRVDDRVQVTSKMITQWSTALRENKSMPAIRNAAAAFKSAVHSYDDEKAESSKYKVVGSSAFNSVVSMCISDMLPALQHVLQTPKSKDPTKPNLPSSSEKWKKIRIEVKSYLTDLMQLMSDKGDPSVLNVLLRHAHKLVEYYCSFPKLVRVLLKKMIITWSSGEESSRVLAFLVINRLIRLNREHMLDPCMKQMYMAYIQNCKFTSPTTLPLINFMQHSLVEIFVLDLDMAYNYAFIYIRQLAIHLRHAITVKKQESAQAVYNWQYIHSLDLWVKFVSKTHPNESTKQLIYPLTQTILGTIKLIPTAKYYPLRFHCIKALNSLAESTDTFIPVLPLVSEIFEATDFSKKHKTISFKPINFVCTLKLSDNQLHEKAFKDGVIDQIYEVLLSAFCTHSHTISFPELALPILVSLKKFLKTCKIANYTKQIKQIVEKVEETCAVIRQRRRTVSFNMGNDKEVTAWEKRSREEGTPLSKYFSSWRKLRDRELQMEISGKERISTDDLPTIVRNPRGPKRATEEERKELSELFEGSDDDSDDDTRFLLKGERPKKKRKTEEESETEYSDFDEDDLAALAGSGDDEEDGGSSDDEEGGNVEEEEGDDSDSDDDNGDDSDKGNDDISEDNEDDDSEDDKADIVEDFQFSSEDDE